MENQDVPLNREALLERIEQSWAALGRDIRNLSQEQLSRQRAGDGWSVKDHLAHLAAWEQKQLAVVEGRPAHEGLGVDAATFESDDVDQLNDLIYQQHKDQDAEEVLVHLHRTHEDLVAAIQKLHDDDLARPNTPGLDADTRSLMETTSGNTYEHYDEHREWIAELVGPDR